MTTFYETLDQAQGLGTYVADQHIVTMRNHEDQNPPYWLAVTADSRTYRLHPTVAATMFARHAVVYAPDLSPDLLQGAAA